MSKPKWENLTPEHLQALRDRGILNGCGPENWRGPRPNFFFKASCDQHDYNYYVGGTEEDRRWADWGFYQAMLKDLRRLGFWQRLYGRLKAYLFYRLVRKYGKAHFNYK